MKSTLLRTGIVIAALMFASAVLAYVLKPTKKLADLQPREKLETLVPLQFGDWRGMPSNSIVLPDPQMAENLARIYTETLSRNYVDSKGSQIMLSVAYGDDQRDGMNLHYPEVCYPAQGFQNRSVRREGVRTTFGFLEVKRLEMVLGQRQEWITYWTMIGDYSSTEKIGKKMIEMRYSLKGYIPDGLLFRISSIGTQGDAAYASHDRFIADLIGAASPETRMRLVGK